PAAGGPPPSCRRTTGEVPTAAEAGAGEEAVAPGPLPKSPRAAATTSARSPSSGPRWRRKRPRAAAGAQGHGPAREEEGVHLLQGAHRVGRLQGRQPAASVHVRPRQDPGEAG